MLKLQNITDKRANIQVRANQIAKLAEAFPSLEAAIRSRNNSDFRAAVVEIIRKAKDEEKALTLAGILSIENLSAFNQFCAEVFEDVGAANSSQRVGKIDVSSLFD